MRKYRIDGGGYALKPYEAIGRPPFPDRAKIEVLRKAGALPAPDQLAIHDGRSQVAVPEHGLAVFEIR